MASANLMAISMKVRPMRRPNTENRNSNSLIGRPRRHAGSADGNSKAKKRVEADDPARNRCGCFLPDLTRLATAPSADFRGRIWWSLIADTRANALLRRQEPSYFKNDWVPACAGTRFASLTVHAVWKMRNQPSGRP